MRIDNSNDGNCLYYAYSISLMYFLLRKNNPNLNNELFTRLHVEPQHQDQLNQLLNETSSGEFNHNAITTIIEPILGLATRQSVAEKIKVDFKNNPKASSLYATMNYAMLYHFYQQAKNHAFQWLPCLDQYQFNNPAVTEADIFRVINTEQLLMVSEQKYEAVAQKFADGWYEYAAQMSIELACSYEEIEANAAHKKNFWELLVGQVTINFFLENNALYLDNYLRYLKTNYTRASKDQLNILHAYVQGEERKNNEIIYKTPISLRIYNDGVLCSGITDSQSIDINLNNEHYTHWTSFVNMEHQKFCPIEYLNLDTLLARLNQQAIKLQKNDPDEAQHALKLYHALLENKERFLSPPLIWLNHFSDESEEIIAITQKSRPTNQKLKQILKALLSCIKNLAQEPKVCVLSRVNNLEYRLDSHQKTKSGAEDGIYHAISHSLMLFLVRHKNENLNNKLFNQLNITNDELKQLNNLLNNTEYTQFTELEISSIIEPILGLAIRARVAEKIKLNFIANPAHSSLYILMKYELLPYFYNLNQIDPTPLIKDSNILSVKDFRFSKEKIYSVFESTQLEQFASEQYPLFKQQFNDQWDNYVSHIVKEGMFTTEEINANSFYKRLFFNKLVEGQTIAFFSKNNYQHLNQYITYLKTHKTYGNAETLYTFHSCIQDLHEDKVSISLRVNDTLLKGQNLKESIGIILDEKCPIPLTAAYDPLQFFRPESVIDERNDILNRYGFNSALEQLQSKLNALQEKKHTKAANQAAAIHDALTTVKTTYLSKRTMDLHTFMHECKKILENEPRAELKKHRGILKILNDFLNIILSVTNRGITFFNKKHQPIKLDKISTKTDQSVRQLEHSIDALLNMRKKIYERSLPQNPLNSDTRIKHA